MASGGYNSAGASGFDALQDFFLQQRAQKRQDLQDRLMLEEHARKAKSDDMDHQLKMEDLAARREDRLAARDQAKNNEADKTREKAIKGVRDEMANMAPGDFPPPALKQKADSLGITIPMAPSGQAIVPAGGAMGAPLPGSTQSPMPQSESTPLTPEEESKFSQWASVNGIRDVDHPDSHYDYRGFWKSTGGAPHAAGEVMHFPDTFKQHGHPTFSVESQYAKGPQDAGRWNGDTFIPPMTGLPGAQSATALPIQGGYAGSPAQRDAALDKGKMQAIIDDPNTQPWVKEWAKLRVALPKGENPPTKPLESPADTEKIRPVYRISPSGKLKKIGDAPEGSHFSTAPQPPGMTGVDMLVQTPDGYRLRSQVANDLRGGGSVALPDTASTRTMKEGAQMLEPHIDSIRAQAETLDKAGLFGPMMSRVRHLAEKVGSLDEFEKEVSKDPELSKDRQVGRFTTSLALLASGAARVHYGGRAGAGPASIKNFKDMLSDVGTLNMFLGRVDALNEYMSGYAAGPHPAAGKTDTTPSSGGQKVRKYNPATGGLE